MSKKNSPKMSKEALEARKALMKERNTKMKKKKNHKGCSGECASCGIELSEEEVSCALVTQAWVATATAAGLSPREAVHLMASNILAAAICNYDEVSDLIRMMSEEMDRIKRLRAKSAAKSRKKSVKTIASSGKMMLN